MTDYFQKLYLLSINKLFLGAGALEPCSIGYGSQVWEVMNSVWPDVWIKDSPKFYKSWPKWNTNIIT